MKDDRGLESVDTSRMVVLASGGPPIEEHWFDVRVLRMLSPFDVEKLAL